MKEVDSTKIANYLDTYYVLPNIAIIFIAAVLDPRLTRDCLE